MAEPETLESRKATLSAQLEAMRFAPGVAQLVTEADAAVRAFKGEVRDLENQIDDIDRLIGARERGRRAEAEHQRQDLRARQREQLLEEEEVRLQAIASAEAAIRSFADAINAMLASRERLATIARALSADGKVPSALSETELVSRISGRLASRMATAIKGHRHRLGAIVWAGGSLYPSDQAWRDAEEAFMARHLLQPLLSSSIQPARSE